MSLEWPKAVFFDWDGTLVDTLVMLEETHNHILAKLDMPAREKGWFTPYFGMEREYLYSHIYGDKIEMAKPIFEEHLTAHHRQLVRAMDGAAELLALFHDRGIPMGIVTNKKRYFIEPEVEVLGWQGYFGTLVCAGEAEQDKPSDAPLLLAIKKAELDLDPQEIWYIGDTRADMECAHRAGVRLVYFDHLGRDDAHTEQFPPYIRKKNCREFVGFLLQ